MNKFQACSISIACLSMEDKEKHLFIHLVLWSPSSEMSCKVLILTLQSICWLQHDMPPWKCCKKPSIWLLILIECWVQSLISKNHSIDQMFLTVFCKAFKEYPLSSLVGEKCLSAYVMLNQKTLPFLCSFSLISNNYLGLPHIFSKTRNKVKKHSSFLDFLQFDKELLDM